MSSTTAARLAGSPPDMITADADDSPPAFVSSKLLLAGSHLSIRQSTIEAGMRPRHASSGPREAICYVIQGEAQLTMLGETRPLIPNDTFLIPPHTASTLIVTSSAPFAFVEVAEHLQLNKGS